MPSPIQDEGGLDAVSNPWKLSGIAGLLFVLLSFAASGMNVLPPPFDQDGVAVSAWFAAHGSRYRSGHFVAGLAFLLFYLPFFAGLCERLREAEGVPALGSRVAWAGALLSPAAGSVAGAFRRGLGWTGLGIGLTSITGTGAVIDGDPQGLFATVGAMGWMAQFLWMMAVAIVMILPAKPAESPKAVP